MLTKYYVKHDSGTLLTSFNNYEPISVKSTQGHLDYLERVGKGAILEDFAKDCLSSLGFNVEKHYTVEHGVDVKANIGNLPNINAQCWNWWGGYPHPKRWASTIKKLKGQINILFCFGVKPTTKQYEEAKAKNIHIIHYPRQLDVFDDNRVGMINWLKRQILSIVFTNGVITNSTVIDCSVNQVSCIDSRVGFSSKFGVCAGWFKGFICKIRGKHAESAGETQDSLDVKDEGIDKKNGTVVPETLGANESGNDVFKCSKCGSSDNEKIRSTLFCDRCLTVMVIGALDEHELFNHYPLQRRELRSGDDYVR